MVIVIIIVMTTILMIPLPLPLRTPIPPIRSTTHQVTLSRLCQVFRNVTGLVFALVSEGAGLLGVSVGLGGDVVGGERGFGGGESWAGEGLV